MLIVVTMGSWYKIEHIGINETDRTTFVEKNAEQ